jgi:hypothetical protein
MTLSVYGQYPMLMVPVAIACTIVFIRHGDGREHSVARPVEPGDRRRGDGRPRC